jgi:hypothetical protein
LILGIKGFHFRAPLIILPLVQLGSHRLLQAVDFNF